MMKPVMRYVIGKVNKDAKMRIIKGGKKGTQYVLLTGRETAYGEFCRTFSVPQGIDAEKICAGYENGILDVTVPLPESMVEKHIPIEVKKVALEEKSGATTSA